MFNLQNKQVVCNCEMPPGVPLYVPMHTVLKSLSGIFIFFSSSWMEKRSIHHSGHLSITRPSLMWIQDKLWWGSWGQCYQILEPTTWSIKFDLTQTCMVRDCFTLRSDWHRSINHLKAGSQHVMGRSCYGQVQHM